MAAPSLPLSIAAFARETHGEMKRILGYWYQNAPDPRGGFHGRVDSRNRPDANADKAVVLNARILWAFSMGFRVLGDPAYRRIADRAFAYLRDHFIDHRHGGVYWSLAADGTPRETRKQLYGQAFALFGLSEYARATGDDEALALAQAQWRCIETRAFDAEQGGYLECFARDWSEVDDYILSKGEARKSMNTHLHLLESFSALYRVWPDAALHAQLRRLLTESCLERILDGDGRRTRLFFTRDWRALGPAISYGHDVEASWLLFEAAELLGEPALVARVRETSLRMAEATVEGLAEDGSLRYECDPASGRRNEERAWWVVAEAMVGYLNAFQLSGDQAWLTRSMRSWEYAKRRLLDLRDGEWIRAVNHDGKVDRHADKISAWKCPYHNARACEEVSRRLATLVSAPSY